MRQRRDRSPATSGRLQIVRRGFAGASVGNNLVLNLLPFIQVTHARPFDRADVHEYVGAAGVRLNKSKALRRIELFHCADRHDALPLNRREPSRTPFHCKARTRRLASGSFVTREGRVVCVLGIVENSRKAPKNAATIKRIRGLARDLKSSPPHSRCRSRRGSAPPISRSPRAIRAPLPNASSRLDAKSAFRCHPS
jgi:hypothetical protein